MTNEGGNNWMESGKDLAFHKIDCDTNFNGPPIDLPLALYIHLGENITCIIFK